MADWLQDKGMKHSRGAPYHPQGDFPQRIHLGGRRVGWHADEVIAWLEARPKGLIGQSCKTHHG
ncbi:MAG: AlpA family phage regulatory protein [Rhodobacteraceae bacterium]|nr:AlpA family phage regulatory protein [Paracoccaceae bacterium]